MSADYRSMWADLGLDLEAHDALMGVLGQAYQDIYLAQENRPEGMGYFDPELVGSVVANVINNSIRYARAAIHIDAVMDGEQLCIAISDDGLGYPPQMIERQSDYVLGIDMSTGSTGLGLYFGERIARLHQRNGVSGHIELTNDSRLGGGEFRIWLP